MVNQSIQCDSCKGDVTYSRGQHLDYRLSLAVEGMEPRPVQGRAVVVNAVYIELPLPQRLYHFCSVTCLREFLQSGDAHAERTANLS